MVKVFISEVCLGSDVLGGEGVPEARQGLRKRTKRRRMRGWVASDLRSRRAP